MLATWVDHYATALNAAIKVLTNSVCKMAASTEAFCPYRQASGNGNF
jgi:putative IMPACT (imprinted ancient) family translation regulator